MEKGKVKKLHWIYLGIFVLAGIWSAVDAYGATLWILESLPCTIGILLLVFTYNKFRFTDITYTFILIHFIILFIGAHYTYARVPAFDWLSEIFGWGRNNYDKLGHFAQGFIPAMIVREVLIRLHVINKRSWLPFLVISVCLAISAFYELFEWWTAVIIEQSAEDFLGMQGYEWDTQSDMFCAMIGAIMMLITLSKVQDRQISKIRES
ncbi:MAG TPA: DUF2238 domain-containing protein [Dysgonomonas sp.]|nr:DUF2238 domain-containing protein [Dysgonomonas sp.]